MWQALLISIWPLSPILFLTSSPLKISQVVWGRRTCSGFSRSVWLGSSPGCVWDVHGVVCKPLLLCVRVTVLLEGERLPGLRCWMLWTGFSLRLSQYFGASSTLTSLSVPAQHELLPAHFTFGMYSACDEQSWFPSNIWGSSDLIILFLTVWGSFRCFFVNSKCVFMRLHWGEDWVWPHRHKAQLGGVLLWRFSYLHIWSWSSTRCSLVRERPRHSLGLNPI